MYFKRPILLFLPALCILSGCHSQQLRSLTPDEQLAVEQAQANSALESDRAGVIFAQKTLELVQRQQSSVNVSGPESSSGSHEQANVDLQIAQTMLHLSEDRERLVADMVNWKSFAKKLKAQELARGNQ